MRTLLELHYDELHVKKYLEKVRKAPTRKSEYKVFHSVAQAHRKKLCQHVELPPRVKDIFQSPADENSWEKLQEFRVVLLELLQGHEYYVVQTQAEADAIAQSIEERASRIPGEVGEDCVLQPGVRVLI